MYLNLGDDLLLFYVRYFMNFGDLFHTLTYSLPADHPYIYGAGVYFIFNFFRQLRRRRFARRPAYYNRPAVFRSYYNY